MAAVYGVAQSRMRLKRLGSSRGIRVIKISEAGLSPSEWAEGEKRREEIWGIPTFISLEELSNQPVAASK